MTDNTTARKRGRPAKNTTRADKGARPRKRVPVHGSRDILTIMNGKDNEFVYRFVKDVQESGSRILKFLQAGYEFVDSEDLEIGQNHVYKSNNHGSIVAVKEGAGYNYLMRIRREWYEEDQAAKEKAIAKTERVMKRKREKETDDGYYGEPKISDGRMFP